MWHGCFFFLKLIIHWIYLFHSRFMSSASYVIFLSATFREKSVYHNVDNHLRAKRKCLCSKTAYICNTVLYLRSSMKQTSASIWALFCPCVGWGTDVLLMALSYCSCSHISVGSLSLCLILSLSFWPHVPSAECISLFLSLFFLLKSHSMLLDQQSTDANSILWDFLREIYKRITKGNIQVMLIYRHSISTIIIRALVFS